MLLGNAALCANFVDEARNKLDHRIGHVAVLGVLEPAFGVKALCNAASNAAKHTRKGGSSRDGIQYDTTRVRRFNVLTERELGVIKSRLA